MAFERISEDEFDQAVAKSPASRAFKKQYARFRPTSDDHCFIHREPLLVPGNFAAPGFYTLVVGDLDVAGLVDLANPDGFDEGGVFVVIGNVTCKGFVNQYRKCSFVDGDLIATDVIVNAFEDASLSVIGNLKTKFFYGRDIWAEVGGRAEMEYGSGYCLPIGYTNASRQAIRPKRNEEDSMALLAIAEPDHGQMEIEFLDALKQGRRIFK